MWLLLEDRIDSYLEKRRQSMVELKMEFRGITINSTEFPSVDFTTSMTARLPPRASALTDLLIHNVSGIRETMLRVKMAALFHFRAPPVIPMRGIKSDKRPRWCWTCAMMELQYTIVEPRLGDMIHRGKKVQLREFARLSKVHTSK